MTNASYAINTVLCSWAWQANDEILVSNQEYSHYWALLRRIAKTTGAVIKVAQLPLATETHSPTPAQIVESIERCLSPRTRALFISHVTSPVGLALPVRELCALARKHGITSIVDGAHAPGMVDVDLRAIDPDFYAANLHKWMMGSPGAAFLYAKHEHRLRIEPLMTFANYEFDSEHVDWRPNPQTPTNWAMSHEYQGTRDLGAFAAIPALLGYRESLGYTRVTARSRTLRSYAAMCFAAHDWQIVSPNHQELATAMLTLAIPGVTAGQFDVVAAWQDFREKHQIEIAFPLISGEAHALLRLSTAWFNTESEIDQFVKIATTTDFQRYSTLRTRT